MKEIIIRQQHPIIEGVERKSITVDEENNCTVIVYGKNENPKFKRGDIVATLCNISIVGDIDPIFQVERTLKMDGYVGAKELDCRLATPEEKQILFTALAKEGKRWNAKTLELEDVLRVPESIKMFRRIRGHEDHYGDGLFIGFSDSQRLGFKKGKYNADVDGFGLYTPIQCELIPCKREDLKAGDTAFASYVDDYFDLSNYCKILGSEYVAHISSGEDAKVSGWINVELIWYKVVPKKE